MATDGRKSTEARPFCDQKCGETHSVGGALMRKRLVGLLASAVVVFAACGTAASPSPSASSSRFGRRHPRHRRSRLAPSAARSSTSRHRLRAGRRHGRRHDHRRRLAGSHPVQPVLPGPGHRGQRRVGRVGDPRRRSPTTTSTRRTSRPTIPTTENGGVKVPGDDGDAMTVTWTLRDGLKWSDGEPLTCDDFKYAWEWVLDPDNVGVVTVRLRGHHGLRVPVRHGDGPPLQERSSRATSPS